MAKKTKKTRSSLKVEALEQRQLLAGITGSGTEVGSNIVHPNTNVYDQVLLTGSSVSVTADAGQITRVSFLDLSGDIVQAEFSGAGTLTISMADGYTTGNAPTNYNQTGVSYVKGLASFTISGSDATTNFAVFSVGSSNAVNQALFDSTHTGGNNLANIARLTVVADPANPSGSTFGGIYAGNAIFGDSTGTVGIAAANVQVQGVVRIGDIDATGTATPTLVFGTNSQFSSVNVQGGDMLSTNNATINNTGSYNYALTFAAGTTSAGASLAAQTPSESLSFSGNNPTNVGAKTFALTTGVDSFTGTAMRDTFNVDDTSKLNAFDTLAGGDGTDTMNVTNLTGTVALTGANATISGIEKLNVSSAKNAVSVDVQDFSGLTSVTITNTDAGQNTTLNTKSNVTSATIVGTATGIITVDDKGSTDSLATLTVSGSGTGAINVTSGVLATLGVTTSSGGINVTGGASALTINASAVTGGTITAATPTSVTINNTGSTAMSGVTVTTAAATSLTVNASGSNVTLADINAGKATSLTVTGAKDFTLSAGTAVGAVTSVNAGGSSGAVTITPALGTGVAYTGSSGVDTLTTGATTKAIALGAGDDALTLTAAPASGGSIDGGDGTDTVTTTSAVADGADANTDFNGRISNVERLVLTGNTNETLNVANLDSISYIGTTGNGSGFTLNKFVAGGTFALLGTNTTNTVNLTDSTGTSDSLNLVLGGTNNTATNYGTVTLTGIETVGITTDDTASSPAGVQLVATLGDTAAKTITVSGDAGLALTFAGTALTSFDASGVTKGAVSYTAGALAAAATLSGGAGADSITADAATKAVTINGNAGNDTISANNANANTINGGDGNDGITTGGGADTIDGGAGNDTINAGAGNNSVVGGAGDDNVTTTTGNDYVNAGDGANTVNAGAGNNTVIGGSGVDNITTTTGNDSIDAGAGNDIITSGSGLDTITGGAGNDTITITTPANGNSYATITDAAAGDIVDFADQGTSTFTSAKITLAATAAFQDYLDAATAGDGSTNGVISWFVYNGDTYIVHDVSAAVTFQNGADRVVKLSGSAVDVSKATLGGAAATLTFG